MAYRLDRSIALNPRFLETFILVANLRSFSLAAERLHTTQANVSARISSLEKDLGVKLLIRNPRDVCLTPQGALALEEAKNVIQTIEDFRQKIGLSGSLSGRLSIGITDSIAASIGPLFIQYVYKHYPKVELELNADTSRNLAKKLFDGQIHLGLLMGPIQGERIKNLNLVNLSCVWVRSPDFRMPTGKVDVEALASYPIISFPKDSIPYAELKGYFCRKVFHNISITTSDSISTIITLVKQGMGISVLPYVVIKEAINAGTLCVINVIQPFPPLAFHAAFRASSSDVLSTTIARTACRAAVDYCKANDSRFAWVE